MNEKKYETIFIKRSTKWWYEFHSDLEHYFKYLSWMNEYKMVNSILGIIKMDPFSYARLYSKRKKILSRAFNVYMSYIYSHIPYHPEDIEGGTIQMYCTGFKFRFTEEKQITFPLWRCKDLYIGNTLSDIRKHENADVPPYDQSDGKITSIFPIYMMDSILNGVDVFSIFNFRTYMEDHTILVFNEENRIIYDNMDRIKDYQFYIGDDDVKEIVGFLTDSNLNISHQITLNIKGLIRSVNLENEDEDWQENLLDQSSVKFVGE